MYSSKGPGWFQMYVHTLANQSRSHEYRIFYLFEWGPGLANPCQASHDLYESRTSIFFWQRPGWATKTKRTPANQSLSRPPRPNQLWISDPSNQGPAWTAMTVCTVAKQSRSHESSHRFDWGAEWATMTVCPPANQFLPSLPRRPTFGSSTFF